MSAPLPLTTTLPKPDGRRVTTEYRVATGGVVTSVGTKILDEASYGMLVEPEMAMAHHHRNIVRSLMEEAGLRRL